MPSNNSTKSSFYIFLLIGFFIVGVSTYAYLNKQSSLSKSLEDSIRQSIKEEVKAELSAELNQNIERIVKEEVQKEFDTLLAQGNVPANLLSSNKPATNQESLQLAVQQTVREVVEDMIAETDRLTKINDEQLDEYVVGEEIESRLQLANNATKTPQKKDTKKSTQSKTQDDSKVDPNQSVKHSESIERTLQQRGSILLPKGKLQIEPSITWAHFSTNRINIQGFSILPVLVIGEISTQEVKRDIFIQNFAFKYGLMNNFQTEIKIPFRGEYDRITTATTDESTRGTTGIGDIELGVSRQIGWEQGIMPDLIAALSVKTPTGQAYDGDISLGTGHWSVRTSLIAAKSSDPAVVFGSLSYTYNFERTGIENIGSVTPGASIGYSLGTAIALSYQTAISFSFDHSITFKTQRNGVNLIDSFLNTANFKTGLNWAINERRSVDFSVSIGLTEDSPDLSVDIRFPFSF